MKQSRLDALADGIFAIVMTILVLEIEVPSIVDNATNIGLWEALQHEYTLVLSYILSFMVLFTYWRAHNYIASGLALTIDNKFSNINAVFLMCVASIPFSSHLLGSYSTLQVAIAVYGLNVFLIGLSLHWMRRYAWLSKNIENPPYTPIEFRHGTIRIITPIVSAYIAILVSFWSPFASLTIFTFAVAFNLSSRSSAMVTWILNQIVGPSANSSLYKRANTLD